MDGNTDICIYQKKNLDDATIKQIAQLKQQWWHYPLLEQIKYLKSLPSEDQHIVGIYNKNIVAYLRLTRRVARIKEITYQVAGLSTVCTDQSAQKKGFGQKIVAKASCLIDQRLYDFGLLQCDDSLVAFFEKCGWKKPQYRFVCINEHGQRIPLFHEKNSMIYPQKSFDAKEIEIIGGSF